ncbi:MAG TPA: PLAT/LH2 domain-containing protein [Terriglobales bacterium]|nr:PLAT/LH2 domain-containing protein [Terriglobales bacterium]
MQTSIGELESLLGPAEYKPSPFYAIAHNTNSIEDVRTALDAGYANAIEVDVTAYEGRLNELCIGHEGPVGDGTGDFDDPRLSDFLTDLADLAKLRNELALVVFDCKPPAATRENGLTLRDTIRTHLTAVVPVNVIISVGNITDVTPYRLKGTTMFDEITSNLGPREGLMIDAQDQPIEVSSFFALRGVDRRCYGYGTSFGEEGTADYRTPLQAACWMRAARGEFRFIYAWTVNDVEDQKEYMRIGVDGIISDQNYLTQLYLETGSAGLARRTDNPFMPAMASYGLMVHTGNVHNGGTDANITFTLHGRDGNASMTVDTSLSGRMERDGINLLVLNSRDLGELHAMSVQRDDSGNAPDWYLDTVTIESFRYQVKKHVVFNCWIDSTAVFTGQVSA